MFSKRFFINIITKRCLYRRRSELLKENVVSSAEILKEALKNKEIKSNEDWKNLRKEVLELSTGSKSTINPLTIDAMTVGTCTSLGKYDLAFNYLKFLEEENIKPNLATIGKYFKLLYLKNCDKLSAEDEEQIISLYKSVRNSHPVLDSVTSDNIIKALSLTKQWKECLKLLEEMKVTVNPSSSSQSPIIAAAFSNNEDDLAWEMLDKMLEKGNVPYMNVYSAYFKKFEGVTDQSSFIEGIEKMFKFLQKFQLKIDGSVAQLLFELCNKVKLTTRLATVGKRGQCECCKNSLETYHLLEEDFAKLKQKVIDNVIIGKDVFNKSTPEELHRFKNFITNMGQFDVVVDGLNVAFSAGSKKSPEVSSALVAAVVSHFVKQDKNVLVLGRKHMNRWPRKNWGYIMENATVFLTQDLSQDDPFLLYCALHSGKDTIIVTKDLMRGHKFLLKNLPMELMFQKWLTQRQYQLITVKPNGTPIFKLPLPYTIAAQKQGQFWHIPYENELADKSAFTNNWLCIKCQI